MIVTESITGSALARLGEHLLDRDERGLDVQRVEDRLGEQHVDAAVEQPAHLLGVRGRAPGRT